MSLMPWSVNLGDLAPSVSDSKLPLPPPGFDAAIAKDGPAVSSALSKRNDPQRVMRKQQALYARATAPLKQNAFMCFMAWMTGSGIQIFSILMTFNLLSAPLAAIFNSGMMFPREDDYPQLDVITPRGIFCVIQLAQLIFGLWKLDGMGLLPVFPSDWISTMRVPPSLEHSFAPLS